MNFIRNYEKVRMISYESEVLILKRNYKLAVTLIILLVLCLGIGIGVVWNRNTAAGDGGEGISLDKNAEEYSDETKDQEEQDSIRFPGYPEITVEENQDRIPIVLTNPEVNPCYFQFSVSLDDGKPVYESDWVKPGDAIRGFQLEKPLEPGDYKMKIAIATKALDTGNSMNGGSVETILHITE